MLLLLFLTINDEACLSFEILGLVKLEKVWVKDVLKLKENKGEQIESETDKDRLSVKKQEQTFLINIAAASLTLKSILIPKLSWFLVVRLDSCTTQMYVPTWTSVIFPDFDDQQLISTPWGSHYALQEQVCNRCISETPS